MTRRDVFVAGVTAAIATETVAQAGPIPRKGRLQQSVCRWCYNKTPIEDLARESARLGIKAIDLTDDKEWPTVKKYGLVPTIINGGHPITDGLNRKENHAQLVPKMKERIEIAAKEGIPSIITFSGNRTRQGVTISDEEGRENCAIALKQVTKFAEDKNVLIVMELLNSKVNHKDYMCDKTPWGVELVKQVDSPKFRLLYDIYHMQIMEGDIIRNIRDYHEYFGHYHTGGNPGRNEIDRSQELNYVAIAEAIVATGFKGYMAHEFIPLRDPLKSLGEAVELCDV